MSGWEKRSTKTVSAWPYLVDYIGPKLQGLSTGTAISLVDAVLVEGNNSPKGLTKQLKYDPLVTAFILLFPFFLVSS